MNLEKSKQNVSDCCNFQILSRKLVPAQVLLDLQNLNPEVSLEMIRKLDHVERESLILKLSQVVPFTDNEPFFYKLMELKNLTKLSQISLIAESYDLRLTKEEVQKILDIIK